MAYESKPTDYVTEATEIMDFGKDKFVEISISYPKDFPDRRYIRICKGWYNEQGMRTYNRGGVAFPVSMWGKINEVGNKLCGGMPKNSPPEKEKYWVDKGNVNPPKMRKPVRGLP